MRSAISGIGFLATALFASPAHANERRVSTPGMASATVVAPLRVRYMDDLSFGAVTVGRQTGGEVAITPSAAPASYSGSVAPYCAASSGCSPHPARIEVRGEPGRTFRMQLPDSVTARGSTTGRALTVRSLTMTSVNRPSDDRRGMLDRGGRDFIAIGGTLAVPAATQPDIFRADLRVSVAYD